MPAKRYPSSARPVQGKPISSGVELRLNFEILWPFVVFCVRTPLASINFIFCFQIKSSKASDLHLVFILEGSLPSCSASSVDICPMAEAVGFSVVPSSFSLGSLAPSPGGGFCLGPGRFRTPTLGVEVFSFSFPSRVICNCALGATGFTAHPPTA